MSKEEQVLVRELGKYVARHWGLLGIDDSVGVELLDPPKDEDGDPEWLAKVDVRGGTFAENGCDIKLEVARDLLEKSPEVLREVLAHEAGHVLISPLTDVIESAAMSAENEACFWVLRQLNEQVAERLGRLLAPILPLPHQGLIKQLELLAARKRAPRK